MDLINEIAVLRHEAIRNHAHVVRLEGLCWGVPNANDVWPVLVFEWSQEGDLSRFMTSDKGLKLSLEDRLRICIDVGIAIQDMYASSKYTYLDAHHSTY
jgi:hypothetical protein